MNQLQTKLPPKRYKLSSDEFQKNFKQLGTHERIAHKLLQAIEHAGRWGLEYEFLTGFLEYYDSKKKNFQEAIGCALYDWDI